MIIVLYQLKHSVAIASAYCILQLKRTTDNYVNYEEGEKNLNKQVMSVTIYVAKIKYTNKHIYYKE